MDPGGGLTAAMPCALSDDDEAVFAVAAEAYWFAYPRFVFRLAILAVKIVTPFLARLVGRPLSAFHTHPVHIPVTDRGCFGPHITVLLAGAILIIYLLACKPSEVAVRGVCSVVCVRWNAFFAEGQAQSRESGLPPAFIGLRRTRLMILKGRIHMEDTGGHNLERLENRIRELSGHVSSMSTTDDFDELLVIIHRPGWTTPAEMLLVAGLVDAMHAHAQAFATLRQALINGSRAVGVAASEELGAEA